MEFFKKVVLAHYKHPFLIACIIQNLQNIRRKVDVGEYVKNVLLEPTSHYETSIGFGGQLRPWKKEAESCKFLSHLTPRS